MRCCGPGNSSTCDSYCKSKRHALTVPVTAVHARSRRRLCLRRRVRPRRAEAADQGRRHEQDDRDHRRRARQPAIGSSPTANTASRPAAASRCCRRPADCLADRPCGADGHPMNVSAPFIVRPIATTLLMIGLALIGLVAYFAAADRRRAAGRYSDHPGDCAAAGRQRRDHGDVGRDAARAAAGADLGRHLDELDELARPDFTSRSSSISAAASTAPRRTFRARSTRPAASCPRTCRIRRPTRRSIRPTRS